MSALVARIMLTIFMLPCAAVVYFIAAMAAGYSVERIVPYYAPWVRILPFAAGLIASWTILALYWLLLWRKVVRWSDRRRAHTRVASIASVAIAMVASLPFAFFDWSLAVFFASIVAPIAWLIWTTIIWRETPAERAERTAGVGGVTCPNCGYNLTGLHGTRCPECGKEFTLDELLAAQTAMSGSELATPPA